MASSVGVRADDLIRGLPELHRQLEELEKSVGDKALKAATNFAMTPVLKQARINAPVRAGNKPHKSYLGNTILPGNLRDNIVKKSKLTKDKAVAFTTIATRDEAFYGLQFVEAGTSMQRKQEWLRPAFLSNKSLVISRFQLKLGRAIDKAAAK